MNKKTEINFGIDSKLEIRDANKKAGFIGQIAGYAIVFNKPSMPNAPFIEYISSSALNNVDLSDVLALYNHDYANVLGRVDAGTLKLSIDNVGLHFVLDMPDTTVGHDVYNNIKAGNLKGMSFGFSVADRGDSWQRGASKPIRTINQLETLGEISVVSKPAYDDTSINVTRSIKQFEDERTRKYKEKVRAYLDGLSD